MFILSEAIYFFYSIFIELKNNNYVECIIRDINKILFWYNMTLICHAWARNIHV